MKLTVEVCDKLDIDTPQTTCYCGTMKLTVEVSEELYRRATEIAAEENLSIEELFVSAFEAWVLEFERLKEKGAKGSYEKFRKVMSKVPPVDPPEYDRL
jgi:hypothetical protein